MLIIVDDKKNLKCFYGMKFSEFFALRSNTSVRNNTHSTSIISTVVHLYSSACQLDVPSASKDIFQFYLNGERKTRNYKNSSVFLFFQYFKKQAKRKSSAFLKKQLSVNWYNRVFLVFFLSNFPSISVIEFCLQRPDI